MIDLSWEDEDWRKAFTHGDVPEFDVLPWEARALYRELWMRVDRAGVLRLGKLGRRAVAVAVRLPAEVCDPGLAALEADEWVRVTGDRLVIPHFLPAQEAKSSDASRAKRHRERAKALGETVTPRDAEDTPPPAAPAGSTGRPAAARPRKPSRGVTPIDRRDPEASRNGERRYAEVPIRSDHRSDPIGSDSPPRAPAPALGWGAESFRATWINTLQKQPGDRWARSGGGGDLHVVLAQRIAGDAELLKPPMAPAEYAEALMRATATLSAQTQHETGKNKPPDAKSWSVAAFNAFYDKLAGIVARGRTSPAGPAAPAAECTHQGPRAHYHGVPGWFTCVACKAVCAGGLWYPAGKEPPAPDERRVEYEPDGPPADEDIPFGGPDEDEEEPS